MMIYVTGINGTYLSLSNVIPALSRNPEVAGLRGPTYRLGGRNDDSFGLKQVPLDTDMN